jgi:hypothetical protein
MTDNLIDIRNWIFVNASLQRYFCESVVRTNGLKIVLHVFEGKISAKETRLKGKRQ